MCVRARRVSVCVHNVHVLRGVGEHLRVLRRRVLGAVGGGVADDHHDRPMRVHLLGHAEEIDAVVGDQVGEVVLEGARHTEGMLLKK